MTLARLAKAFYQASRGACAPEMIALGWNDYLALKKLGIEPWHA